MMIYYPTPEQTAECGYCGHRANVTAFWFHGLENNGSECPVCGGVDDFPPILDEEDIAEDIAREKEESPLWAEA